MKEEKREKSGGLQDRLRERGEEAMSFLCGVMNDGEAKLETRIAVAKTLIEFGLGKPERQSETGAGAERAPDPIASMSLAKRRAAVEAAIRAYGRAKQTKHK